jgi:hypothetical protein
MIIFNDGTAQTADLEFKNGGYYIKTGLFGVVSTTTDIRGMEADAQEGAKIYTLDGRRIQNPPKGIYIQNNKKIVIR